ncbi:MAG: trypsin-like serine protease [Bdellovibrionota bacterium]
MRSTLIALAFLILTNACRVQEDPSFGHIVKGDWIKDNTDPTYRSTATVLMGVRTTFCSGTLIAPNIVLSAAHCFNSPKLQEGIKVAFGSGPVYAQTLEVERVVTHPDFALAWNKKVLEEEVMGQHTEMASKLEALEKIVVDRPLTADEQLQMNEFKTFFTQAALDTLANFPRPVNDIALLLLKSPASEPFIPAQLPARDMTLPINVKLVTAGFGFPSTRETWAAGRLRRTNVVLDSILPTAKELVVRGLDGEGFCKGDSGGPTYDLNQAGQTFVIGINVRNRTSSCEDPAIGHLTHVSLFLDWIECQTEGLNSQIQAVCPT